MSEFMIVLAIVSGALAVTRAVHLVVDDDYPPMVKLREWWIGKVGEGSDWAKLVECPWCAAPYLAAPAVAWFALMIGLDEWSWIRWSYFIVTGWAAVSFVAAWLNLRDVPPDMR